MVNKKDVEALQRLMHDMLSMDISPSDRKMVFHTIPILQRVIERNIGKQRLHVYDTNPVVAPNGAEICL